MEKIIINKELLHKLTEIYDPLEQKIAKDLEQRQKKLQLLHRAVEEYCAKQLINARIKIIEIIQKTLEINIKDNFSCIDATIYLWNNIINNGSPLSSREEWRAYGAIEKCLAQNEDVNTNIIFTAIESAIAGV